MSNLISEKADLNALKSSKNSKKEFISMHIDDQLFGIEVLAVHDVLKQPSVSKIPLAAPEVYGLLNLRGRIVTAIDVRVRLGLPKSDCPKPMCVVVEHQGEPYGLIIDQVGDVLHLSDADYGANPVNLSPVWQSAALGVYMLKGELLIVLDVARLLSFRSEQ